MRRDARLIEKRRERIEPRGQAEEGKMENIWRRKRENAKKKKNMKICVLG